MYIQTQNAKYKLSVPDFATQKQDRFCPWETKHALDAKRFVEFKSHNSTNRFQVACREPSHASANYINTLTHFTASGSREGNDCAFSGRWHSTNGSAAERRFFWQHRDRERMVQAAYSSQMYGSFTERIQYASLLRNELERVPDLKSKLTDAIKAKHNILWTDFDSGDFDS